MCNYVFSVAFVFAVVDPHSQYEHIRFNNSDLITIYHIFRIMALKHVESIFSLKIAKTSIELSIIVISTITFTFVLNSLNSINLIL